MLKVAILLGGPSPERAISLNSARSLADHLADSAVAITALIYFDTQKRAYEISRTMLYSNTPKDFDFKLSQAGVPLSEVELASVLRRCDLAFPAMHGEFGEDGGVQELLERLGVAYVGSGPAAAAGAYDKFAAFETLRRHGLPTVPTMLWVAGQPVGGEFGENEMVQASDPVVIKPAAGGSSLDVVMVHGPDRRATVGELCRRRGRVVMQPRVEGTEFTVVVLEGPRGPVALLPVEVERTGDAEIFSFREKYMATDDVRYHCPPRWPDADIDALRSLAETVFSVFGLRDFARIDCWRTADGSVLVSDINPISGMEQNSFLFIQAAHAGMAHRDVLRVVVASACRRAGIDPPLEAWARPSTPSGRIPVPVLFGGQTAERQVSVLSGTNVWLKLLSSQRFAPAPYLLETDEWVWSLPYAAALRHSAEQIAALCRTMGEAEPVRKRLAADVVHRLELAPWQTTIEPSLPRRLSLEEFLEGSNFVFIALHGGFGEDGRLQAVLDRRGIAYNGCGPEAAKLCANKYETGWRLRSLEREGIATASRVRLALDEARALDTEALWRQLTEACGSAKLIGKPLADGCSAGVVPLESPRELSNYLEGLARGVNRLSGAMFASLDDRQIVEMPTVVVDQVMFESFIETDDIEVIDAADGGHSRVAWGRARSTGWIEITGGVLGPTGAVRALVPSVTIAQQGVLSVEEKFMGGTGVNLTPPPSPPLGPVDEEALRRARRSLALVANVLGIRGYARIDAFLEYSTGNIVVIEANTLPGLTPSTVLYHQGLAEDPPVFPKDLLERIVDLGFEARGHAG